MLTLHNPSNNSIQNINALTQVEDTIADDWLLYFDPLKAFETVMAQVAQLPSSQTEKHTHTVYSAGIRYFFEWAGVQVIEHPDGTEYRFEGMASPTKDQITRFVAHLMTEKDNHRGGIGVSANTVGSKYLTPIRHWLTALSEQSGHIPVYEGQLNTPTHQLWRMNHMMTISALKDLFRVASNIKNPKGKRTSGDKLKQHGTWLKEHEVNLLYATCDDSLIGRRDLALLYIGFNCGLRQAELCRLTLNDIEPAEGHYILRMRRKGAKDGRVGLDATGHKLIMGWVDAYNADLSEDDPRRITDDKPIFQALHSSGNRLEIGSYDWFDPAKELSNSAIRGLLERRCKQVQDLVKVFPIIRPHDMRRTTTGILRSHDVDLLQIQQVLQHESPKTTAGYLEQDADLAGSLTSRYANWAIPEWAA